MKWSIIYNYIALFIYMATPYRRQVLVASLYITSQHNTEAYAYGFVSVEHTTTTGTKESIKYIQ